MAIAAVYFLFFTAVPSVSSPSAAISLIQPIDNTTITENTTSISASNRIHVRCDGDLYERNLRKRSCINAQRGMVEDMDWFSIGPRDGPMHTDVELPYRWISGMQWLLNHEHRSRVYVS